VGAVAALSRTPAPISVPPAPSASAAVKVHEYQVKAPQRQFGVLLRKFRGQRKTPA